MRFWLALTCVALAFFASPRAARKSNAKHAVVHIVTHASPPDYLEPWQRSQVVEYSGSGVIISDGRILTNAHLVADPIMIEVRKERMARRVAARVEHVCHPCDLAVLTVDEPDFFDGVRPLALGPLPGLQEKVEVYGFPIGGESISVTSGVVSRIEMATYAHSLESLLLVQIDAAVNEGNSGGPAIADGKIVGIAAQSLDNAENIGFIIPTPIIRHFLKDVEDGRFDGFPRLGVDGQAVQNQALRRFLGLPDDVYGGLVRRVDFGSPAWEVLQVGDVILGVNGQHLTEDLTVPLENGDRVYFQHEIRSRQVGETLSLEVLRDGERLKRKVTLNDWTLLVPGLRYDRAPSYYVFAGLVVQPLTLEYLLVFQDSPPPHLFRYFYADNLVTPQRQQVLVISQILTHPINKGYALAEDQIVATVNGESPRDLKEFASMVEKAKGPWLEIVTEDNTRIVLDLLQARAAAAEILSMYGLPAQKSPELVAADSR
jgi:S1-C subfamily serine protease